jgi:CyaY protein
MAVYEKRKCNMSETEFLNLAESTLNQIQTRFEDANDADILDVECQRSGNVLEIEFIANGSKIIVNSQAAMQEIWVAARSGGFHYRHDGQFWLNTRDNQELFATLSALAKEQGGAAV